MASSQSHTPADDLRFAVVLPAAGTGRRMGGCKKPLLELGGEPILFRVIETMQGVAGCVEVVPVLHAEEVDDSALTAELRERFSIGRAVRGGDSRQASVFEGLKALESDAEVVLVHDAVRPLVSADVVRRVARAAAERGGAIAAVPCSDTVKEVGEGGTVIRRTVPRETLWLARTPQGFRRDVLLAAEERAAADGFCGTDEAQIVERIGGEVHVVEDARDNLKITTHEDLAIAEAILRWHGGGA
jgi:2-C-methyl-D-erythritol 4-phosphate cytidylyltransferase